MTTAVTRLRGEGPAIEWPSALDDKVERCAELWRLQPDFPPFDLPPEERRAYRRKYDDWLDAREDARRACVHELAAANGWTRAKTPSRAARLLSPKQRRGLLGPPAWSHDDRVFEHPDWMRQGSRLAGVIVHIYPPVELLKKLPEGIIIDELPASWYYPQHTRAYLLRPAAAVAASASLISQQLPM